MRVLQTTTDNRRRQVIFVSEVILFSCLTTVLICIKNPSLFGPCINISNKVILVFSCIALCFYCFYVFSMFHFYCIVMCIDVRLSHPNKDYLLTYLQTPVTVTSLALYTMCRRASNPVISERLVLCIATPESDCFSLM